MEYVSLFPVELTASLVGAVAAALAGIDVEEFGRVLLSPSVVAVQNLVLNGARLSVLQQDSTFSPELSQVRKVSVSGNLGHGERSMFMRNLLYKQIQCGRLVQRLHVHFAESGDLDFNLPADEADADLFHVTHPEISFRDLILPEEVERQLRRALLVIKHRGLLANWGIDEIPGLSSGRASLNFVGPSGTGKTFAAQVIAGELSCALIEVDYAGLESKYVGETSKHIKTVFKQAKEQGAILFFDEADSFLGRRIESVEQSYDAAVNNTRSVMLMEMQAHDGFIIFATNLPTNYDPAFRRRILDHIYFPLPDEAARKVILVNHTPRDLPGRDTVDFALIAKESDGLSGGDLANLAYQACVRVLEKYDKDPQIAAVDTRDFQDALKMAREAHRMIPGNLAGITNLRNFRASDE